MILRCFINYTLNRGGGATRYLGIKAWNFLAFWILVYRLSFSSPSCTCGPVQFDVDSSLRRDKPLAVNMTQILVWLYACSSVIFRRRFCCEENSFCFSWFSFKLEWASACHGHQIDFEGRIPRQSASPLRTANLQYTLSTRNPLDSHRWPETKTRNTSWKHS